MRFLLFAGNTYYAQGGFHDLVQQGDRVAPLVAYGQRDYIEDEDGNPSRPDHAYEWWHIYDTLTQRVVARSESMAYGAEETTIGQAQVFKR